MASDQFRTYDRTRSVVFLKTDEPFGGLSNMARGFPLHVLGTRIYTSEALYQACRFPHLPEVQRMIIGQTSPMTAKMKSKPHRQDSRPDWDRARVKVMRWCLRVKLAQNWAKFSDLLLRTGDRPIVEESRRDNFWGAKPVGGQTLVGRNALGRLLMELREAVKAQGAAGFQVVEPLDIPEFLFLGRPIGTVGARERGERDVASSSTEHTPDHGVVIETAGERSLFDAAAAREGPTPAYITAPTPESTPLEELRPYTAMKDSGVPWLGQVPKHWAVRRLKYLLRERDLRSLTGSEQLLRVSQFTGVTERKRTEGSQEPDTRAESLVGYKLVEPEDLVVNIMLAWNGSMGVSRYSGIASPAYCVYRFSASAHPWYFHHLLRSPAYKARIKAVSTGVVDSRLRLYSDDLYRLEALLPPGPEQAAIVRFLDHADRRIRRYIRAKQQLIKLLEEQKQAVIHRAVTRGIDPSVRLKPSGVEWLGDMPQHWEVIRSKRVFVPRNELALPGDVQLSATQAYGVISQDEYERRVGHKIVKIFKHLDKRRHVEVDDFVISMRSFQGGLERAWERGCIRSSYVVLHPNRDVCVSYFARLFKSPGYIRALQATANFIRDGQDLNYDNFCAVDLPWPPLDEQARIAEAIEVALATSLTAGKRAAREIDLLREFRTRLIADVVTGKLDIREVAARLPAEVEEPEARDEIEPAVDADEAEDVDDTDQVPEEVEA